MAKKGLDLSALEVETFHTTSDGEQGGTALENFISCTGGLPCSRCCIEYSCTCPAE